MNESLRTQTGCNGTHHSHQTNFSRDPPSSAQEIPLEAARARQLACAPDDKCCAAYLLVSSSAEQISCPKQVPDLQDIISIRPVHW